MIAVRFLLLAFLLASDGASAQGTVAGRVFDADTLGPLVGAIVRLEGTSLGAATDIDGGYQIRDVPAGTYTVVASYVGMVSQTRLGVQVADEETRALDVSLVVDPNGLVYCPFFEGLPLVDTSPYASRVRVAVDIERMPVRR